MQADFLAIDVGNTNVTIGLVSGGHVKHVLTMPSVAGEDGQALELGKEKVGALSTSLEGVSAAVASVNPQGLQRALELCKQVGTTAPIVFGRDQRVPVENKTLHPEQVGIDRLINAFSAYQRSAGETIVVDFGSAVSFDVVDQDGAYLGGVLTPGIGLAMRALSENTAQLPLVKPSGRPPVIGKDTVSAINSGVYYGYIGLARNIIQELSTTFTSKPRVICTGGDGDYLAGDIGLVDEIVPYLTLEGIYLAYQETIKSET